MIELLLRGASAAMSFTDPPCSVQYGDRHASSKRFRDSRPIDNDNLGEGFEALLAQACRNILHITSGAVYLCMPRGFREAALELRTRSQNRDTQSIAASFDAHEKLPQPIPDAKGTYRS